MTTRIDARTALLMTLPPLLWAANAVVGRLTVGSVPPLLLNALRWLLALVLLWPLGARVLRDPHAIAARWRYLLAIALLVIARGHPSTLADVAFVRGDLYMLAATVSWAFYSWLLARPPASMRPPLRPDWDWAGFLWLQTLFGVLVAGTAAAAEAVVAPAPVRWDGWVAAALVFVAIGPSIVAYRCWGLGVAEGGPALAAFFANLTPVFAAVLSAAVLGEAPRWFHAAAFGLIVLGILVSSRKG